MLYVKITNRFTFIYRKQCTSQLSSLIVFQMQTQF